MPVQFSRRHRHRLLLPPGLLALAGLLLLGCLALRPWQERLKRQVVMQLTMPRLPRMPDESAEYGGFSVEKLSVFGAWHDTYFNGNGPGNQRRAAGIIRQAAAMQANPLRDQRLRVQLRSHATYAEMVFLLNTMLRYDIKKYVFDIRHYPTTFYAFTVSPLGRKGPPPLLMPCGGTGYSTRPTTYSPTWHESASYRARLGHWLAALRNPALRKTAPYISARDMGAAYDVTLLPERHYLSRSGAKFAENLTGLPKLLLSPHQADWRWPFLLLFGITASSCWRLARPLLPR